MVRKAHFAVLDFIVLNAFCDWNLSVSNVEGQLKVIRGAFYAVLWEELIAFEDTTRGENATAQTDLPVWDLLNGHCPIPLNNRDRIVCAVWKLEKPWMDAKNETQVWKRITAARASGSMLSMWDHCSFITS